jgi:exopolysaccharide production protein ExoQ
MKRTPATNGLKSSMGAPLRMWSLAVFSMMCFVLAAANLGGPLPLAAFLGIWVLVGTARPAYWLNVFAENKLLWLMPVIAIASILISQDPAYSARTATELVVATGCSIVLTKTLGDKAFVSSLAVALLFVAGISFVFGGTELVTGQTGDALHGVFESKNYFALILSLGCLANLAVLLDRSQPALLRILGSMGVLTCIFLLIAARSVDAVASTFAALLVLGFVTGLGTLPPRHRPTLVTLATILLAACVLIFGLLSLTSNLDVILASLGKNSSLTGRTYLWLRAAELIAERPVFGYGYQAFWIHDFTEAEGLWRWGHVVARAGYHFHNLYYETLIELGYIGLTGLIVTLLAITTVTTRWALRNASARSGFFLSLVTLFLLRSPLEVDLGGPFSIGTILLTATWVIGAVASRFTKTESGPADEADYVRATHSAGAIPPILPNEI